MQITFEVPVVLKAKPGRAVNERTVFGYTPVTVDVPEVDARDAPVVLRYVSPRSGVDFREEFRGYAGKLFHDLRAKPAERVSMNINRHRQSDDLFDPQWNIVDEATKRVFESVGRDYLSHASAKMHPASYGNYHKHRHFEVVLEPISEMDLRGDFERDLNRQVEVFYRQVSGLVIIDGRFHRPEAEPLIRLKTGFSGDVVYEAVREAERGSPSLLAGRGNSVDTLGYFRFDDLGRLHEETEKMSVGHRVYRHVSDVEVLDDSYFEADADAMTLAELGSVFRQYFACSMLDEDEEFEQASARVARTLARLPIDQIALYQRLCAGIETVERGGDVAELEEAIMTIMESDHGSIERHLFVYGGSVARYAQQIVERWNDRKVDLSISARSALSPR